MKKIKDEVKKELVMKVLKILDGESAADAREVLKLAEYYLSQNAYLDYELAAAQIEAGDD